MIQTMTNLLGQSIVILEFTKKQGGSALSAKSSAKSYLGY